MFEVEGADEDRDRPDIPEFAKAQIRGHCFVAALILQRVFILQAASSV